MRLLILTILFLSCAPKKQVEPVDLELPTYEYDLEDMDLDDLPEAGDTGESL